MAFTLDHEIIDDIEREAAIESAAAQIHATFGQVDTLQALARMVGAKKTNSFVHRDLKRVIVADRH